MVTARTLHVDVLDIGFGESGRRDLSGEVDAARESPDDMGTIALHLNDEGNFAESWLVYSNQAAYDAFSR
jgi:hypothetical protein